MEAARVNADKSGRSGDGLRRCGNHIRKAPLMLSELATLAVDAADADVQAEVGAVTITADVHVIALVIVDAAEI